MTHEKNEGILSLKKYTGKYTGKYPGKYQGLKTKVLFRIIPASCIFLSLQATVMADGPQNRQVEEAIHSDDLYSATLHLKWRHQFQFAGYYAAVEKGSIFSFDILADPGDIDEIEAEKPFAG